MYSIIPREEFEEELDEIEEYISVELLNPDAALKIVESIWDAVNYLELYPKMHPVCETRKSKGETYEYRRLVKGNYSVLYHIVEAEKAVYLAHIYNNKQMFDFRFASNASLFVNESSASYSIVQEKRRILMLRDICPQSIKECWNINLTAKTIEHVTISSDKLESRIYQIGDIIYTRYVTLDVAEAFGIK